MAQVIHGGRNPCLGGARNTAILVCLLTALAADAVGQAPEQFLEYQVKAAFLLNFTKFIDWPPGPGAPDSPIGICILGKDPFGRALDDVVQGETINGRPLIVERLSPGRVPQFCQVLFIGAAEKDVPKILSGLGRGILTVGDGDKFVRAGGMIAFVLEDRHVRFDINQTAAANAGLKLSSKLLSVARSVEK